jgi:hypothetical protein
VSASWLYTATFMAKDVTEPGGRGTHAYALS